MKKAFAIGCWLPTRWHERELLACIRSIRLIGHTEDIFVLTIDPDLKNRIGERDWKVLTFPEMVYPGIVRPEREPFYALWRSCAQKLYYWCVPETYDKVVGLDCDILFHHYGGPLFDLPAVTGFIPEYDQILLSQPPISFGHFLYRPDIDVFKDLRKIVQGPRFSNKQGWCNCGLLEWDGQKHPWKWFGAHTSQGYLYYYFAVRKKTLNGVSFHKYLFHYCGKMHVKGEEDYELYVTNIHKLLL